MSVTNELNVSDIFSCFIYFLFFFLPLKTGGGGGGTKVPPVPPQCAVLFLTDIYFLSYFWDQYPKRYHHASDGSHLRIWRPKGYQTTNFNLKRNGDHPRHFYMGVPPGSSS